MMARRYLPPKCGYTVEGGHMLSDGTVINKVTGTMVASILGLSPWGTPFQSACSLLGLAREDISGKPSVRTGQALERRIIEYAGERYADYGLFLPASDLFGKREGDHDDWASDFEDEVFGGHVDGMVMAPDGIDYILEIKTSSNLDAWADGVPEYYYWQVALYNRFLCDRDRAFVVLGLVDEDAYANPATWRPSDDNVVMFEVEIDREEVEDRLAQIREWYDRFILNCITPEYDPSNPRDAEMFSYLASVAEEQDTKGALIDRLMEVERLIAEQEEGMKGLKDARESLRRDLKEYMTAHGMAAMPSESKEYTARLTDQVRRSVDPVLLMEDGIDPEIYTVEKVSKVLTVKPNSDLRNETIYDSRGEE